MRKILRHKVLSFFVEMLLGFCFHYHIMIFYFMFILRFRQADFVATVLSPPVSNDTGDIFLPVSLLPEAWNR